MHIILHLTNASDVDNLLVERGNNNTLSFSLSSRWECTGPWAKPTTQWAARLSVDAQLHYCLQEAQLAAAKLAGEAPWGRGAPWRSWGWWGGRTGPTWPASHSSQFFPWTPDAPRGFIVTPSAFSPAAGTGDNWLFNTDVESIILANHLRGCFHFLLLQPTTIVAHSYYVFWLVPSQCPSQTLSTCQICP